MSYNIIIKTKMKNREKKQKILAWMLLFVTVLQMVQVPVAAAFSIFDVNGIYATPGETPKTSEALPHYGLAAILVEDGLMNGDTKYDGLQTKVIGPNNETLNQLYPKALTSNTLAERVRRYALDVQRVRPFTKSVILKIPKTEKVENIRKCLRSCILKVKDAAKFRN